MGLWLVVREGSLSGLSNIRGGWAIFRAVGMYPSWMEEENSLAKLNNGTMRSWCLA